MSQTEPDRLRRLASPAFIATPGQREMSMSLRGTASEASQVYIDIRCLANSCRAQHDAVVTDLEARFAEVFGHGAVAQR